mgnify:CR=1 FL=1
MLHPALAAALKDRLKRHAEIEHQLADPAFMAEEARYRAALREHGGLAKLAAQARRLDALSGALAQAAEMLKETDPELRTMAAEEQAALGRELDTLEAALQDQLLAGLGEGPLDRNVILEVRAGTGGDEASLFAQDIFRMYSRYAARKGWTVEILDENTSEVGGFKEVVACISGEGAFAALRFESGGHRVQRVPATETQGRIHTSACTVAVLPEAEEVDIDIKTGDLRIDTYRAGGPGGQNVNKVSSAIRITHLPTGLVVQCQDQKSQHKNKAQAMKVLRSRLFEMEQAKRNAERSHMRRTLVGSGDRNERIRTYNFPQDRLTDHRIGLTLHNLPGILDGDLDALVRALSDHDREESLKQLSAAR